MPNTISPASATANCVFDYLPTTLAVTGLSKASTYTYKVLAVNAAGSGPASAASATATMDGVPDAPMGLQVTEVSENTQQVSYLNALNHAVRN